MSFVFDAETLERLEKVNRAQLRHNRGIFLDVKPAWSNDLPPAYNGNGEIHSGRSSIDESKIPKVSGI